MQQNNHDNQSKDGWLVKNILKHVGYGCAI